jgi:hypothetical protein
MRPKAEGTIKIDTTVRKSTVAKIQLKNPLKQTSLQYLVHLEGNSLKGPTSVSIEPGSLYNYKFEFSPGKAVLIIVMRSKSEGMIRFTSEIGEFWYKLELNASDADPIHLDPFTTYVGHYEVLFSLK